MKANLIKTSLLIVFTAVIFASCEKSDITDVTPSLSQQKTSLKSIVSSQQFAIAYQEMEAKLKKSNAMSRNSGAEFILPFFTSDGFGIAQNIVVGEEPFCPEPEYPDFCYYTVVSGQFAQFFTEFGPNDLFRENADGTVTVHTNSKNANAIHYDIESGVFLSGTNANLNMSYTGPVRRVDVYDWNGSGEIVFTYYYIEWWGDDARGAVSFHGNGKVREGDTGPFKSLVARSIIPAGQGKGTSGFTLK